MNKRNPNVNPKLAYGGRPARRGAGVALLLAVASGTLGSAPAHAETFEKACPDIVACARAVSALTGDKYLFDQEARGRMAATGNLELTQANATVLFTTLLDRNGYTRVPLAKEANTFMIATQRDARDELLPLLKASATLDPEIPDNYDWYQLKYQATHPDAVETIAKIARSFMPANSRVIPADLSGQLLVTASAQELKNVLRLFRDLDKKPTAEMKARWEQRRKEHVSGQQAENRESKRDEKHAEKKRSAAANITTN
jgi:hypothetical protein